ncbi:MAG: hypothetical protein GKS01_11450 [Alphaproteobacteria bacterium]|nr:hypothetical protein [Alphaproteobacteria bacterium]
MKYIFVFATLVLVSSALVAASIGETKVFWAFVAFSIFNAVLWFFFRKFSENGLLIQIFTFVPLLTFETYLVYTEASQQWEWSEANVALVGEEIPTVLKRLHEYRGEEPNTYTVFSDYPINGDDGEPIYVLAPIPSIRTIFCNEAGKYIIYDSDEFGFNNDKVTNASAFVVGDSFAQGACVDRSDSIHGQLNSLGTPSVTVGVSATGPLNYLAVLREYFESYGHPRNVFFHFLRETIFNRF